eukprot:2825473-Amphidinium_carterae.1
MTKRKDETVCVAKLVGTRSEITCVGCHCSFENCKCVRRKGSPRAFKKSAVVVLQQLQKLESGSHVDCLFARDDRADRALRRS